MQTLDLITPERDFMENTLPDIMTITACVALLAVVCYMVYHYFFSQRKES